MPNFNTIPALDVGPAASFFKREISIGLWDERDPLIIEIQILLVFARVSFELYEPAQTGLTSEVDFIVVSHTARLFRVQ